MTETQAPNYVPASYSIPQDFKERIERMAAEAMSNPSIVVRRILADYFAKLDTPTNGKSKKTEKVTA